MKFSRFYNFKKEAQIYKGLQQYIFTAAMRTWV